MLNCPPQPIAAQKARTPSLLRREGGIVRSEEEMLG